jgi:hypothetical protein
VRAVDSDVRLIGFDPAAQPPFGTFVLADGTETHGEALPAGHVFVTERLARSLDAARGDRLTLSLPTGPHEVTVGGVVRSRDADVEGSSETSSESSAGVPPSGARVALSVPSGLGAPRSLSAPLSGVNCHSMKSSGCRFARDGPVTGWWRFGDRSLKGLIVAVRATLLL